MSEVRPPLTPPDDGASRRFRLPTPSQRVGRALFMAALGMTMLSVVTLWTGSTELTSGGTFSAALRLAVPLLLAGMGGIFAERTGIINIGLEGMMILGTWFGAWGAITYGPWWGVVLGITGGAIGGLVHAIATATFGIDQIVSGVAINILAGGVARFLSVIHFTPIGGGANQSPRIPGGVPQLTAPVLAGGEVFGTQTPNLFGWLDRTNIPLVSEFGAIGLAFTRNISALTVIALLLVPTVWFVLWRTTFGLRLRSVGEHPVGAESLGVNVYLMKYIGVTISGALAGMGGAILAIEASGIYREGQTGGREFIALAAMIFGDWRPGGVLLGAGLFGYANALELRPGESVQSLLLFVTIVLLVYGVVRFIRTRELVSLTPVALSFIVGWAYVATESVPSQFVFFTPHLTTLVVLAFFSQRLRPPAAINQPYRRGQQL
jgi:general nucleoside transport system permease protein